MGDAADPLEKAARHQAAARLSAPSRSSAFLISTGVKHDDFCSISKVSKSKLISAATASDNVAAKKPPSEQEIIRVRHTQSIYHASAHVLTAINPVDQAGDHKQPEALPGGVPLIEHIAAFIARSPTWACVQPKVNDLLNSRLPTPVELNKERELTPGVSSVDDWVNAGNFLKSQDLDLSFIAADTESIPLLITWPLYDGAEKPWEALLLHITLESLSGSQQLEFTIAPSKCSACSLPVRFFFGSKKWQIHFRLPITHHHHKGQSKVVLRLDTILPEEAKQMFLELPSMVGVGITNDYIEWGAVLEAIWNTTFFRQMRHPMELEHLARAARINTSNSSILQLNWYCMGTVIAKGIASLGDRKWGQRLRDLPVDLKQYLTADIVQVVKDADTLELGWFIQLFPDLTVVQDASSFSALEFVQWAHKNITPNLIIGIQQVEKDAQGKWVKLVPRPVWKEQESISDMVEFLDPPTRDEFPALWLSSTWPSITCGGPRSIHQVRCAFTNILPELHKLDPVSWIIHPAEKLWYWQFGVSIDQVKPVITPTSTPGFVRGPGFESHLSSDPSTWTKAQLEQSRSSPYRSDRMLICEFATLHPERALSVLTYMETKKTKFRGLVGEARMKRIVMDIRHLLVQLNICTCHKT